jgi:hypothetical protein
MRKARLLSTVAATLLLTVGAASAQTMKNDETPGGAPAAQQNAPAEKIAPTQKIAPALKTERKTPETTGQAPPKEPEAGQVEKGTDVKKGDESKKGVEMNKGAEPHAQNSTDLKAKSNESAAKENNATTGQGAAAGSAKLSSEQSTKITSIIRQHKVAPAHLNVTVRVGTRVPESVHFYPLPREVFVIYPEWRGYDYIRVGDEILVINPRTHEIVAVLDA